MTIYYLKACPRCTGDMVYQSDVFSEYKNCMQCGYDMELDKTPILDNDLRDMKEPVASRRRNPSHAGQRI